MKRAQIAVAVWVASTSLLLSAQTAAAAPAAMAAPVTVSVTLDHNRIVIDVYLPLKDGTTKRVRGLVDTGSAELMMSRRVAQLVGGAVTCTGRSCTVSPPAAIQIGGLTVPWAAPGRMSIPFRPAEYSDVMIPGMSPEILIPSTILKNYDVVIDYANRQFTIGPPGSVKFSGPASAATLGSDGLVTVASKAAGGDANFGIDSGAPVTLVRSEQLAAWHKQQPGWPYLAGALGAANVTGDADELHREMLRLPSLQVGSSKLQDVVVASGAKVVDEFEQRAHVKVAGVIGGEAFRGAKLGIDYAHGKIYLESADSAPAAGMDVVGLTVRPEVDGKYTVVAVAPYAGKASVPEVTPNDFLVGVDWAPVTGATMGQVWSLLGGEPGQTRKLVMERDGKRFTVEAVVRRWMGAN